MNGNRGKKEPAPTTRDGVLYQLNSSLHTLASHLYVYANVLRQAAAQQASR